MGNWTHGEAFPFQVGHFEGLEGEVDNERLVTGLVRYRHVLGGGLVAVGLDEEFVLSGGQDAVVVALLPTGDGVADRLDLCSITDPDGGVSNGEAALGIDDLSLDSGVGLNRTSSLGGNGARQP